MLLGIFTTLSLFARCLATQQCHPATGRCFWMSATQTKEWATAVGICESEGGILGVMETEELYNYVITHVRYFQIFMGSEDFKGSFTRAVCDCDSLLRQKWAQ